MTDATTDEYTLLGLLADIRAAAGDREGRLMQPELVEHIRQLKARSDEAKSQPLIDELAECFNLGGADADGNGTEWRAVHAVRSVRQLRQDYDEACDETERLRQRIAKLEAERSEAASLSHQYRNESEKLREEVKALRRLLFYVYTGPILGYTDDGELQDGTAHPAIDFARYTPEQIAQAISRREGKGGRGGELRQRVAELERQNAELERLCDEKYCATGADAYHHCCEQTEAWDAERLKKGLAPIYGPGEGRSLCGWIESIRELLDNAEADRDRLRAECEEMRADAERWRQLKNDRAVLLVTGYFGNGCVNRTVDDVEAVIDAARAAREGK